MSAIPVVAGHSFADADLPMEDSLYGRTAQVLVPVFEPTGFGEWHMTGALMTGFIAKDIGPFFPTNSADSLNDELSEYKLGAVIRQNAPLPP